MLNRRKILQASLAFPLSLLGINLAGKIPSVKTDDVSKQETKEEYLAKVIEECENFIKASIKRWPQLYLFCIDVLPDNTKLIFEMGNTESVIRDVFTSRDTYIEDMNDRLNLVQHLWKYGKWNKNHDIYACHIQNITISKDFYRKHVNELGKHAPYARYISFQ